MRRSNASANTTTTSRDTCRNKHPLPPYEKRACTLGVQALFRNAPDARYSLRMQRTLHPEARLFRLNITEDLLKSVIRALPSSAVELQ